LVQVPSVAAIAQDEVSARDALLEEAKKEPKRKLLSDHIETIKALRNEKRFTIRSVADWLTERGIAKDRSAVYRECRAGYCCRGTGRRGRGGGVRVKAC